MVVIGLMETRPNIGNSQLVREDSQIDFATANIILHILGGGQGFYIRMFLKF